MKTLALIICLVLVGCQTEMECRPDLTAKNTCSKLPLTIDLSRSNVSEEEVQEAINEIELHVSFEFCGSFNVFDVSLTEGSVTIQKRNFSEDYLGMATWHFSGGKVVSCEIQLDSHNWNSDILIHELLHCVGIAMHDDPEKFPESVMIACAGYHRTILSHHAFHLLQCEGCLGECSESEVQGEVYGEDLIY